VIAPLPTDAQRAVSDLEAAGVSHSGISIVANNSDGWFSKDKKVDRDHDGVDDRAEGASKGGGELKVRHPAGPRWRRRHSEGRTRTPEPLMFAAVHVGQSLHFL
jgi:hypothetical protein